MIQLVLSKGLSMPINPKTGKMVKEKSLMQKQKTAAVKKHNKAFGIKPKKASTATKTKRK